MYTLDHASFLSLIVVAGLNKALNYQALNCRAQSVPTLRGTRAGIVHNCGRPFAKAHTPS